jgi:hypothetical protein
MPTIVVRHPRRWRRTPPRERHRWNPQAVLGAAGRATLIEDTVERVQALTPLSRTITVIDRSHLELAGRIARAPLGLVTTQPMDRGTAAACSSASRRSDPIRTPSFFSRRPTTAWRTGIFRRGVLTASRAVKAGRADIIALRRQADGASQRLRVDRARVGRRGRAHCRTSAPSSRNQPQRSPRACAGRRGVEHDGDGRPYGALLDLYREHLPALTEIFRRATALPEPLRADFLTGRYPDLAHADFSRDLITQARGLQLHVWPESLVDRPRHTGAPARSG